MSIANYSPAMTATAAVPAKRRLSPAERRDLLLELGLELFGEGSYDVLSTEEIAERAGISRGLLFHYFGSKRGYYVAVIREAANRLLERSQAVGDEDTATTETLLEGFLGFVEENAGLFTLLMQSGVGVDGQVKQIVDETRRELARRVAPSLASPSSAPIEQLALTAWMATAVAQESDAEYEMTEFENDNPSEQDIIDALTPRPPLPTR